MSLPPCPKCQSSYVYSDRSLLICPECAHEWDADAESAALEVRCANGNLLQDGDSVAVIKDLKIKGSSGVIKMGTKAKNIRVLDPEYVVDGHDIDCKLDGFGAMKLKSSVVKKL
ncbi:zinc ribbon domain-containing protein YjdM [Arenicella chitinivorans]|uniref:zinc ribbon domain-containing protein YjdM n=1 Tax=Arenicella chitinivorans TaxID=1329800 RepID=UPI001678624C|nr:zinc ribbon domain-containing protein YjdM [Arenicella chitinivorans]